MSLASTRVLRRGEREQVAGRRIGYLVAAGLNAALLWIAHQLLDWGWPSFLTGAFDDLLPYVTVSLAATMVVHLVWMMWDPAWFKHLAQLGLDLISVVVTVRAWQIFPFDFSGLPSWWEPVARLVIAVGIVGSAIGSVAEAVRLAREVDSSPSRPRASGTGHGTAAT